MHFPIHCEDYLLTSFFLEISLLYISGVSLYDIFILKSVLHFGKLMLISWNSKENWNSVAKGKIRSSAKIL